MWFFGTFVAVKFSEIVFFFALLERSLKFIDLLHCICVRIDSGDSGRIDYDERAILSLLDRTSSHDDAPDDEKDIMANEYLASFKVKQIFNGNAIGLNLTPIVAWGMLEEMVQAGPLHYVVVTLKGRLCLQMVVLTTFDNHSSDMQY